MQQKEIAGQSFNLGGRFERVKGSRTAQNPGFAARLALWPLAGRRRSSMKVLALETSGSTGSIALWTGQQTTEPRQWPLPATMRSARSLAPTLQGCLAEFGWKPREIELVAVTTGPGSFTSIRIGVVMAKAFAYAVGCPAVGVHTLEAIARQAIPCGRQRITALMDAQRDELFVATFGQDLAHPTRCFPVQPTTVVAADVWLSGLQPGEWVTGPGIERLITRLPRYALVVEANFWQPQAATVARAGFEALQISGDSSKFGPFALLPQYFRRTAAEEQWDKRHTIAT